MSGKIIIKGLKGLQRNLANSKKIINSRYQTAIRRGTMILVRDLKQGGYVPFKGGKLKESIRPAFTPLRSVIQPHKNYAIWVHDGTDPSPGRYVPAIGKRVKTGMHPGIKGVPFMDIAMQRKKREVEKEFEHATGLIAQDLAK